MSGDYFNMDHSLIIDFERCSTEELKHITQILYSGSTECYQDIELAADEIIVRLDIIAYELKNPQNSQFVSLVHYIFKILKKIRSTGRVSIIHGKFNEYLLNSGPSPVISPINSPKS